MGWGVSKVFQSLSSGGERRTFEKGTLFYLSRAAGEIKGMVTWAVASCFSRKELLSVRSMGINHSTTKSPVTRAPNSHSSQRFMHPLPGGEETGGTRCILLFLVPETTVKRSATLGLRVVVVSSSCFLVPVTAPPPGKSPQEKKGE